jgi:hypothetical protein
MPADATPRADDDVALVWHWPTSFPVIWLHKRQDHNAVTSDR